MNKQTTDAPKNQAERSKQKDAEELSVINQALRLAFDLDQDRRTFPGERLLTASEVQTFLRLEERTMYRLLESGDLPSFKIRGQIRILLSDLALYLRRCYRIRPYPYREGIG